MSFDRNFDHLWHAYLYCWLKLTATRLWSLPWDDANLALMAQDVKRVLSLRGLVEQLSRNDDATLLSFGQCHRSQKSSQLFGPKTISFLLSCNRILPNHCRGVWAIPCCLLKSESAIFLGILGMWSERVNPTEKKSCATHWACVVSLFSDPICSKQLLEIST